MIPRELRHRALCLRVVALAVLAALAPALAPADTAPAAARVEAHSSQWLIVGLVQGERMEIRLSRVLDNAPVHDAAIAVLLRGTTYPTVAEADGSYALTAKALALPGEAAVEFDVAEGQQHESLKGTLKTAASAEPVDDHGNARQMWWWALNFGVCAGFLVLWSRRKKAADD